MPQMVPPRPAFTSDPGASQEFDYPRPGFNADGVELRPIEGTTETSGPGRIWMRLRTPVVAGEPTSPLLSLLAMSDLGIAVGWEHSPAGDRLWVGRATTARAKDQANADRNGCAIR